MIQRELSEVHSALTVFLEAFDNLEWDRFIGCFAEGATVYLPFAHRPHLAVGKAEIESGFAPLFDELPSSGTGPPYLHLDPIDTRVDILGDMAVVTFRLDLPDAVGRRSIIFGARRGAWKIVHLHASNISA